MAPSANKQKLTRQSVERIPVPARGDTRVWDTALPNFLVRVLPSGVRTYVVHYRNASGRQRWVTIGRHGELTAEQARRLAQSILAEVRAGEDPSAARRERRSAPTMAEFAERYLTDYALDRKKASSLRNDRRNLEAHVVPALGRLKMADIGRQEVTKLHQSLRETPYVANRVLALLSKMFNLAERWGVRPDHSNPCRHVEKFKERRRERFLSHAELSALAVALRESEETGTEPREAVAAIRLLLLTGCRLSEILTLRWEYVDITRGCLQLPDSKTGAKTVPLNAPALAVLREIERIEGNPYVLPGRGAHLHYVNLRKPWTRIRARAGLDDVRIHDLRHSFASVAVSMGLGLPITGKLLGHTQAATTQRYAHLDDDPVRAASERVGLAIERMMLGQPAKILPFPVDRAGTDHE